MLDDVKIKILNKNLKNLSNFESSERGDSGFGSSGKK